MPASKNLTGGDDLDDGLDLNADYLPLSDDDDEAESDIEEGGQKQGQGLISGNKQRSARGRDKGKAKLSDEDDFDLDGEDVDDEENGQEGKAIQVVGKKRKAGEAEEEDEIVSSTVGEETKAKKTEKG